MQWTGWITLAALTLYFWVSYNAAVARVTYRVAAPSMDGPPAFLRIQRVQANTVEQMLLFLPALWLCAYFFSDRWAALGGAIWIVGRVVYALAYYKNPAKRSLGFGITITASVGLMAGAALGLLLR
jgi:glutathione S-transferase